MTAFAKTSAAAPAIDLAGACEKIRKEALDLVDKNYGFGFAGLMVGDFREDHTSRHARYSQVPYMSRIYDIIRMWPNLTREDQRKILHSLPIPIMYDERARSAGFGSGWEHKITFQDRNTDNVHKITFTSNGDIMEHRVETPPQDHIYEEGFGRMHSRMVRW